MATIDLLRREEFSNWFFEQLFSSGDCPNCPEEIREKHN